MDYRHNTGRRLMMMSLTEKAVLRRETRLKEIIKSKKNKDTFSLSRQMIPVASVIKQSPETRNQKWSVEDQSLFNFVLKNISTALSGIGELILPEIQKVFDKGPDNPLAKSGQVNEGLKGFKALIQDNINNAKKHQAELNNKNAIKTNTNHTANTEWNPEDATLVNWLSTLPPELLPSKFPFNLCPWIIVTGPKFFEKLREEIAQGPQGVAARSGALRYKLIKLKEVTLINCTKKEPNVR